LRGSRFKVCSDKKRFIRPHLDRKKKEGRKEEERKKERKEGRKEGRKKRKKERKRKRERRKAKTKTIRHSSACLQSQLLGRQRYCYQQLLFSEDLGPCAQNGRI
jgi:hypothetical protein